MSKFADFLSMTPNENTKLAYSNVLSNFSKSYTEFSHENIMEYLADSAISLANNTVKLRYAVLLKYLNYLVQTGKADAMELYKLRSSNIPVSKNVTGGGKPIPLGQLRYAHSSLRYNYERALRGLHMGFIVDNRVFTELRDYAIMRALLLGLRREEIRGIEASHVDSDTQTLVVNRKGGKQAKIPLPIETAQALVDYFENTKRKYLCNSSRDIGVDKKLSKRGLSSLIEGLIPGYSPHDYRHTVLSELMKNHDSVAVSLLSSHSSVDTLKLYQHGKDDTLRDVVDSIDEALSIN